MYHGGPACLRIVANRSRVERERVLPIAKGTAMRDDASVIALVARVGDGDQGAWNELIERYSPLVWSIFLRYRLDRDAGLIDQDILAAERAAALRAAFGELPHACHELLSMLVSDPPSSYADISAALGVAMGSIGPARPRPRRSAR